MQCLVEQFDDPAYVVRFDGAQSEIDAVNSATERVFGYAAEEMIGHGIDERLRTASDTRARLRRVIEMRRRGSWRGRTVLLDRRGRPLTFLGDCHRLTDGVSYLTVLWFRPVEFAISLREFAQSVAQSEQCSVVERRSGCNGDGEMREDAKQHRCDKTAYHLQRLREARGLTREQLENQIGATRGHVSRWESAQWEPSPYWLAQLAEFFGVEEAEFFREPIPC